MESLVLRFRRHRLQAEAEGLLICYPRFFLARLAVDVGAMMLSRHVMRVEVAVSTQGYRPVKQEKAGETIYCDRGLMGCLEIRPAAASWVAEKRLVKAPARPGYLYGLHFQC